MEQFLVPLYGMYIVNVRSSHIHTTYSPYYRELHKVSILIRQTKWYIIAALDDNLEHDYGGSALNTITYTTTITALTTYCIGWMM